MSEVELKPCPFCGGKASDGGVATYQKNHEAWWADGTRVLKAFYCNCMKCGSSNNGIVGHQTKEDAIENWNARPVENELLAACERALLLLEGHFDFCGCPAYDDEGEACLCEMCQLRAAIAKAGAQ